MVLRLSEGERSESYKYPRARYGETPLEIV
jgi:hypothetical protein